MKEEWIKFTEEVKEEFEENPPSVYETMWCLYRSGDKYKVDRVFYNNLYYYFVIENSTKVIFTDQVISITKSVLEDKISVEFEKPYEWTLYKGEELPHYQSYWAIIRDDNVYKIVPIIVRPYGLLAYYNDNDSREISSKDVLYITPYSTNKPLLPEELGG